MEQFNCIQGEKDWFLIRCGKPTSSNFSKIITTKGEPSKSAKKYMYKLAGEVLMGMPEDTYQNDNMLRGCSLEDEARSYYEIITENEVNQVGFCLSGKYGCSPDGFIGEDGLIEIKCPILSTHIEYLLENKLPLEYFQQVQGQLLVTGRKYVDFISYYPEIKPLIVKVERDEVFISKLKNELDSFCKELENIIEKLKKEII